MAFLDQVGVVKTSCPHTFHILGDHIFISIIKMLGGLSSLYWIEIWKYVELYEVLLFILGCTWESPGSFDNF